ncbi:MAG: ribonuclease Y, partial [Rhodothermales bacterium]
MEITTFQIVVGIAVTFGLGFIVDRYLLRVVGLNKLAGAKQEAQQLLADAERDIEALHEQRIVKAEVDLKRREAELEENVESSRRSWRRARQQLEERHEALNERVRRINDREKLLHEGSETLAALTHEAENQKSLLSQMTAVVSSLRQGLDASQQEIQTRETELALARVELGAAEGQARATANELQAKLEEVSRLSADEARQHLVDQIRGEAEMEAAAHVKDARDNARLKATREARKVILSAIQRTAASHAIENTVSVVNLASDEMKG